MSTEPQDTVEVSVVFTPGRDSIPGLRDRCVNYVLYHLEQAGLPDTVQDVEQHITFAGIEQSSFSDTIKVYKARYTVRKPR